jgi:uncharacterized damage-inducible protein DinB
LFESLDLSTTEFENVLSGVDEQKSNYKYAEGKWTIKQVVQHIIDVERLFVARALSIARDENATIVSFDEDDYANNDYSELLSIESITEDYRLVTKATVSFFKSLNSKNSDNEVGGKVVLSPRIIGWLISGHSNHHIQVIKERYL